MTGTPIYRSTLSGDEAEVQRQLTQYAHDFQELLGRYSQLVQRHENLKDSHGRLSEAKQVLGRLTRSYQGLCLVVDQHGNIECASESARLTFMLNEGSISQLQQLVAPFHLPHVEMMLKGVVDGNDDFWSEQTDFVLYPGGDPMRSQMFAVHFLNLSQGKEGRIGWFMRELPPNEAANADMERLSALDKRIYRGAMVIDTQGKVLAVDPTFSSGLGYASEELRGETPQMIRSSRGDPLCQDAFLEEVRVKGGWQGEIISFSKTDQPFRQSLCITPVKDRDTKTTAYLAVFSDEEMMVAAERAILDAICHDPLTNLPTLSLFKERGSQKIAAAWRGASRVALLSVTLDRLQWLARIEGEEVGETLIQIASERVQEAIRGCDILTRSGPDKFAILLVGPRTETELSGIARRMIEALSTPIHVRKKRLVIGGSIGCALFPHDGIEISMLIEHAETAMHQAHKEGGNRYRMYSHTMPAPSAIAAGALEQDFRKALEQKELYLAYQPHVASNGHTQLLACEAHLRWRHSSLGDVSWEEYTSQTLLSDASAETGIRMLSCAWLLRTACQQLKTWQSLGLNGLNMVINLTAAQLRSEALSQVLAKILAETGLDPCRLELTLTEMENSIISENDLKHCLKLRKMGVRIILRNFGTYRANPAQITTRPFDGMRVERSFVRCSHPKTICDTGLDWVVGIGSTMELDLISDPPQHELFSGRKGYLTQGYLKGCLMMPDTFSDWALGKDQIRNDTEAIEDGT